MVKAWKVWNLVSNDTSQKLKGPDHFEKLEKVT